MRSSRATAAPRDSTLHLASAATPNLPPQPAPFITNPMKAILLTTILAATFVASRALAGDVAYELAVSKIDAAYANDAVGQSAIELVDREWAAPGIEQADFQLPPAQTFDFASKRVFRIQFDGDGPYWLDDVIWPRTRAMFHQVEEPVTSLVLAASDDSQVHYFGGLQR